MIKKTIFALWQWIALILLSYLSDKRALGLMEVVSTSALMKAIGVIVVLLGLLLLEMKSYHYAEKYGFSYMTFPISIACLLQKLLFDQTPSLLWIAVLIVCFVGIKIGQCIWSYKRYRNILEENKMIIFSICYDLFFVISSCLF